MTIRWPCDLLVPRDPAFDIAPRTLGAPPSVSGVQQVVSSDAGIWKVSFAGIRIRSEAQILVFRAIATLMEGRIGEILVPRCRGWQPKPQADGLFDGVPHDDDTPHDDGALYVGGATSVHLTSSLSLRATSANVAIDYGGTIHPGMDFSIGERMYRVRSITYTTPTTAAIAFRPPLRDAADEGDFLEFDDPVCRMKLASDDEMNLELQLHKFGNATVRFIEAV